MERGKEGEKRRGSKGRTFKLIQGTSEGFPGRPYKMDGALTKKEGQFETKVEMSTVQGDENDTKEDECEEEETNPLKESGGTLGIIEVTGEIQGKGSDTSKDGDEQAHSKFWGGGHATLDDLTEESHVERRKNTKKSEGGDGISVGAMVLNDGVENRRRKTMNLAADVGADSERRIEVGDGKDSTNGWCSRKQKWKEKRRTETKNRFPIKKFKNRARKTFKKK